MGPPNTNNSHNTRARSSLSNEDTRPSCSEQVRPHKNFASKNVKVATRATNQKQSQSSRKSAGTNRNSFSALDSLNENTWVCKICNDTFSNDNDKLMGQMSIIFLHKLHQYESSRIQFL